MTWDAGMAAWWVDEIARDDAYRRDVDPLLDELLPAETTGRVLDLGCGDGRLAGHADIGVDRSLDLLRMAGERVPVAAGDLTDLPFATDSIAGAFGVLVLEHVAEPAEFFGEAARVVVPGGWLVVIFNHPLWTAPGAGPLLDPSDGEVLWRWGTYLEPGYTDEPISASESLRFHHRPLGDVLSGAAAVGWKLEQLEERAIGHTEDPILAAQTQIPRLMGAVWHLVSPAVGEGDRRTVSSRVRP